MNVRFRTFASIVFSLCFVASTTSAQPSPTRDDVKIDFAADAKGGTPVRLGLNPKTNRLLYLTRSCEVYRLKADYSGPATKLYGPNDHGLGVSDDAGCQGMAFGPQGRLFVQEDKMVSCGQKECNVATIRRGTPTDDGTKRNWSTVVQTEPYLLSNTAFDHRVNAIVVSPDGKNLYINSGSRSDHGEAHNGKREVPLTSAIFRLSTDAVDVTLPNDIQRLRKKGYLFADGTRNHFDLAFAPNGDLFGVENAGDRDDPDELNWLRNGHHYGFPWRIGGNRTPQYYLSAAPDTSYHPDQDPLLNPDANAVKNGFFYNDPSFPDPPDSITFTAPVRNVGPDEDHYRDPVTGKVLDASDRDTSITSFTAHRSPLGLVFDRDSTLSPKYAGGGFVLGYTSDGLHGALNSPGEDLLYLDLDKRGDQYQMSTTRIVKGFERPIDDVMIDGNIYVIEYGGSDIWEVTLPTSTPVEEIPSRPGALTLLSNTPNPFAKATNIHFALSHPAKVRLTVYDVLGRQVAVLVNGKRQRAGTHDVRFDAENLPGGVYFYRLSAGSTQASGKMLLVK